MKSVRRILSRGKGTRTDDGMLPRDYSPAVRLFRRWRDPATGAADLIALRRPLSLLLSLFQPSVYRRSSPPSPPPFPFLSPSPTNVDFQAIDVRRSFLPRSRGKLQKSSRNFLPSFLPSFPRRALNLGTASIPLRHTARKCDAPLLIRVTL